MSDTLYTTLERQGNITVITQTTKINRTCRAKKISKTEYVNLATGEICEYEQRSENRSQCHRSLLRTFATIRGIVNANSADPKKVGFVTLTYAEPQESTEQLYKDFSAFWKRFVRWSKRKGWEKPEYLVVCEPNAPAENPDTRQRFHFHLLLFYQDKAPFLPNSEIETLWRKGFTKVSSVSKVSNLGAYLSAYLSDVVVDGEGDETKTIDGEKKSVIKGGRLHLYPAGFNIYRCSRGVKRPVKTRISEQAAEEYRRLHEQTFSSVRTIKDPRTGFETTVFKEWFDEGFPHMNNEVAGECSDDFSLENYT